MRLKKLIKSFEFAENNRSLITLDGDIRLNPEIHCLQIKDSGGEYSTAADITAKTWTTNPDSVKQWLGFESVIEHKKDLTNTIVTGDGYRLGDGTDEYWWNGASWEVNVVDWNTEAEVATNISSFSVVLKKIQVIINLTTTDVTKTPYLREIKILWASDVEFQEDLVTRSLIPDLRSKIRPISDFPITVTADTTTIDLANDYRLKTPYNVVEIDSCFNHTEDEDHFTDLYQSFDVDAQIITLNSTIEADEVLWIRFIWEPEVRISTGQEYIEIEKVPVIYITGVTEMNSSRLADYDVVKNKSAGTAVKIFSPQQGDLEIRIRGVTGSQRDQQRLKDEFGRYFKKDKMLISKALDEKYTIIQTSEYDMSNAIVQNEIYGGMISLRIVNALFYQEEDQDVYIVQNFVPVVTKQDAI